MESLNEEFDFNKPNFSFIPSGIHNWRQHGYYLVCYSCELQHAVWVGDKKIMVGVDDEGRPIFKTRKELGIA